MDECAVVGCNTEAVMRYVMDVGGIEVEAYLCAFHDVLITANNEVTVTEIYEES